MSQVGQERDGAIDLAENRISNGWHARDIGGVTIGSQIAIGGVDIGVCVDRPDSAIESPLNEASADPAVGVTLPGEEDMVGHRRKLILGDVSNRATTAVSSEQPFNTWFDPSLPMATETFYQFSPGKMSRMACCVILYRSIDLKIAQGDLDPRATHPTNSFDGL
ncbi:MAG: hypothetical protein QM681_00550 [Novosphingobium sp.]